MSSSSMLSSSSSSVVQYSDIQKHGGNKEFSCPSGFKFSPNDRQLVTHYLKNKIMDVSEPANLIKEFEFQNINPDQIPMDKVRYGKKNEVFYFTSKEWRGSKTSDGHWEATGEDEKILDGDEVVGFKKVFIFLWRKELIETKSQWVMQEYRINPSICSGSVNGDDDKDMIAKMERYVLCRIQKQIESEDIIENCEYCRELENQDDSMEDIQPTEDDIADPVNMEVLKE